MTDSHLLHTAGDPLPGDGLVQVSQTSLIRLRQQGGNLPLRAIRVRSRTSGAYLSRLRGLGMEFDEARPYQAGDEIRNIDWRITARTGQPHSKLFREEKERVVTLWVDYRAPMYFATQGRFKSVLASEAAAMIAWSTRNLGDRLGGLLFSEQGHQELRPRSDDRTTLRLIGLLAEYSQQAPHASLPHQRREAARNALLRISRVTRPGSLIFLISDFRDFDDHTETQLTSLARHNDLILIRLFDPLEAELPQAGRYTVSDGKRFIAIDSANRTRRQAHLKHYQAQQTHLEQVCRRHGMHLFECASNDDLPAILKSGLGRKAN